MDITSLLSGQYTALWLFVRLEPEVLYIDIFVHQTAIAPKITLDNVSIRDIGDEPF